MGVVDEAVEPVTWAKGGCKAGLAQLFSFLRYRLRVYAKSRNDPTKRALSNLSPWLHFGKWDCSLVFCLANLSDVLNSIDGIILLFGE